MKKKILIASGATLALIAGVIGFSAFEAHIINVTAHIENALSVPSDAITFGTVFPEEILIKPVTIGLSTSFLAQDRLDSVDYVIRQKPKCVTPAGAHPQVTEVGDTFICPDGSTMMNLLCPFLSKTPGANNGGNDGSLAAFHGPILLAGWTPAVAEANQVLGELAKGTNETDLWNIDLHVPCFAGQCAQDNVVPAAYQLDPNLNGTDFGCDLWFEVTGIYEEEEPPDQDQDGVIDSEDNCPTIANQSQLDTDNDGFGNPCDNCPSTPNPDQLDSDNNGTGDACEIVTPAEEICSDGEDNDGDGLVDEGCYLLISEVLYNPSGTEPDGEWIEIYNPTPAPIDLSNYKIGDEETLGGPEGMYKFPAGASIAAGDYVVVAGKATAFFSFYGFNPDFEFIISDPAVPDMTKYTAWSIGTIGMANGGDEVLLLDGSDIAVDVVVYLIGSYPGVISNPSVSVQDHSLARSPVNQDTNNCAIDFVDLAVPTPGL